MQQKETPLKSVGTAPAASQLEAETVASAKFQNSDLLISTSKKGWIDSNVWYKIAPDGSALLQTAWCPGKDIKEGTYKEIYDKAMELSSANNGELADDDASKLVEMIKNTDIIKGADLA